MPALIAAVAALMIAAAALANGQTYPGPSQRIEPLQPMQSMQPMQPIAPLPAPPMSVPGDNPLDTPRAPTATDRTQGSGSAPATGSEIRREDPPAEPPR